MGGSSSDGEVGAVIIRTGFWGLRLVLLYTIRNPKGHIGNYFDLCNIRLASAHSLEALYLIAKQGLQTPV